VHLAGGGAEDGGEDAVTGSGAGGDGVYTKGDLGSECLSCCRGLSIRGGLVVGTCAHVAALAVSLGRAARVCRWR
jgi:hypothetical protein